MAVDALTQWRAGLGDLDRAYAQRWRERAGLDPVDYASAELSVAEAARQPEADGRVIGLVRSFGNWVSGLAGGRGEMEMQPTVGLAHVAAEHVQAQAPVAAFEQ